MPKSPLKRLEIKEPCGETWSEMSGTNEVRFCSHCSKNVHDLSGMTRSRAEKLIRDSSGSLCVRYIKDERGSILHFPSRFSHIKRGAAVAASVLAASVTISAAAKQIGPTTAVEMEYFLQRSGSAKKQEVSAFYSITGRVVDPLGALIPGAEVVLISLKSGQKRFTRTNSDGDFQFTSVEPGKYDLEIVSPGFKKLAVSKIEVSGDINLDSILMLEVGETLMGVVGIAEDPVAVCEDSATVSDKIETQKIADLPPNIKTVTMGIIPAPESKVQTDNASKRKVKKQKSKLPK